jgi:hypothetical protein
MISTLGNRYKTVATSLSYLSQDAPFLPHPYDSAAAIAINEQSGTADFCRKLGHAKCTRTNLCALRAGGISTGPTPVFSERGNL